MSNFIPKSHPFAALLGTQAPAPGAVSVTVVVDGKRIDTPQAIAQQIDRLKRHANAILAAKVSVAARAARAARKGMPSCE